MTIIQRAIDALDPPTQAKLAQVCGQLPQAVTRWMRTGKVPAHHCAAIEKATNGEVTCRQLRPDVFPKTQAEVDSAA